MSEATETYQYTLNFPIVVLYSDDRRIIVVRINVEGLEKMMLTLVFPRVTLGKPVYITLLQTPALRIFFGKHEVASPDEIFGNGICVVT